jgi:CRP-like cAMP-binding protein
MAIKKTEAKKEQSRKASVNQHALSHPATVHEAALGSVKIGASPEEIAEFDPHVFLTKLAVGKTSHEYKNDQSIFSQGDAADAVFYIQSGKVKLTAVSVQGKEAVVAILPENSFLGEGCLAGQKLRMATATAVRHTSVIRVTRQAMVTLLHQEPEFAERFLAYLLSRNIRMEADLVDHLFNSSEKRLARLLLLMANFGQESKPIPLIAKVSQETLAEMIGTTRSRVSFFMNRFRELGFIEYDGGGLHVHSSLARVVLYD